MELQPTHDMYENSWKRGELRPIFSQSAGGLQKQNRVTETARHASLKQDRVWRVFPEDSGSLGSEPGEEVG